MDISTGECKAALPLLAVRARFFLCVIMLDSSSSLLSGVWIDLGPPPHAWLVRGKSSQKRVWGCLQGAHPYFLADPGGVCPPHPLRYRS